MYRLNTSDTVHNLYLNVNLSDRQQAGTGTDIEPKRMVTCGNKKKRTKAYKLEDLMFLSSCANYKQYIVRQELN